MKTTEERIKALEAELQQLKQDIKPTFEIGKWYKIITACNGAYGLTGISMNISRPNNKPLNYSGCFFEESNLFFQLPNGLIWGVYEIKESRPATESEVFEALKKEAIKKAGDGTIKCLHDVKNAKISDIRSWEWDGRILRYYLKTGGVWLCF